MLIKSSRLAVVTGCLVLNMSCPLPAQDRPIGPIRIGALATLEGPFAQNGQDAMRGVDLAIDEFNATVAGRKIELIKESSNAKPDIAVAKTRKLIELDKADIVIGPLSGGEGLAVKEYAKTVPTKTFVNGNAGAADMTLRDPASNFFRFNADGAQWQAGLGTYALEKKGYKTIAIVADDYSFPYTQVMGFQNEFCKKGGRILQKNWVPIGTKDYSTIIAKLPTDVDAIYVLLGGADAANFFTQYYQSGGKAAMIGGTITVDQTVLSTQGNFQKNLVGIISAGPVAASNPSPEWQAFTDRYRKRFPGGFPSPSVFATGYYIATKAVLIALQQVSGDLSSNQAELQKALSNIRLETPTGLVILDENRQAIADNFVTEVALGTDGKLFSNLVSVVKGVNQTLGHNRAEFLSLGTPSRDNPACTQ